MGKYIIGAIVVIAIAGGVLTYGVVTKNTARESDSDQTQTKQQSTNTQKSSTISWSFNGQEWQSDGKAPECPDPLTIPSPVEISKATAILYPGQTRGGNYKPHGGFIFKGSANDAITVTAPLDATITKGSRYIEQGETQYYFVFVNSCGLSYKFDHLLTLSPVLQKIAETLPEPKVDDSRTTDITPAVTVKAGDELGTAVGFKNTNNTSVDFGVYDLRSQNAVSQTAAWKSAHSDDMEFGAYGVCWLNLLSGGDAAIAAQLPGGDGQAGKQSDYCK